MKKVAFILVWLVLPVWIHGASREGAESRSIRFYLKIKGAALFSNAGDFGQFVSQNRQRYAQINGNGAYTITETYDDFFKHYSAEIGFETSKHAIGFSVGRDERKFTAVTLYNANFKQFESTGEFTFSAIPIFLFYHYKVIDAAFFRGFITIGSGVYLTTYKEDLKASYLQGYTATFSVNRVEARKNHLGAHIGVTCDFQPLSFLGLTIDAGYRVSDFRHITGTSYYEDDFQTIKSKGDLYYSINKQREGVRLGIGKINSSKWEERVARFNLSGFQAGVGLKISL